MSQQQHVVKQSTSTQQSSSSVSMQQSRVQQQTQVQTHTVREVQQGVQRVQGPTQIVPVGLPAGASPPVFEQIFRNARFAQGGDAMFEGKVTGNPKPTVTWTRKGAQIAHGQKYQVTHDETTGVVTLLITAIGPGDEGEYTCTAANQFGEAICTVYIQPEAAFMMQQQRQQQQSMQMSQSKTMMQQQHMSQQSISQQQQQHMMSVQNGLTESFRVDTFEYRLLHEVEFRQTLSVRMTGEAEVEVGAIQGPPQAPQLQQKPRSTKVSDGGNATFTVSVNGYPTPRVIWFKNGTRIQASDKFLMTQSAGQVTLVVKQVNANDNGYYTMLAENNSGCTVASAQLAVVPRGEITNGVPVPEIIRPERIEQQQAPSMAAEPDTGDDSSKTMEPKFVRGPTDREVQEGRMVRFDARVTGRPYPEVFWYINGVLVVDDNTHKVLVNEAGNHSLMINKVSLKDAGILTCVARNKSGEATFQCQLSVLEMQQMVAPKFVERFQQCSVSEGETVVLQCRAVGTPMPVLSWQKDGVTVENTQNVMVQFDQNGASCLQVLSAGAADAGWYQCNAQNSAGSTATRARLHVKTAKAPGPSAPLRPHFPKPTKIIEPEPEPEPELIILRPVERAHHVPKAPEEEQPTEPPKFTHPLRDIDIVEGTRAHFEAKVIPVGDATMNVEWLIDGRPLSASSRATVTYRFGFVALDLLNVIKADAGVYTCRATNVKGQAETSANLRVTERPLIESQTQHPEAMQQISYLEDQSRYQRTVSIDESTTIKPTFVKPLCNLGEVIEGKYAHFEAQLHPVSDPFMKIEWFKDGKHITASSRINVIYNFGYVALNIMQLREEDSGTYTVRATNKAGECSCQASIKVITLSSVTGDLGIPEQAQHIKSVEEMEAYRLQMLQKTSAEMAEAVTAPVFKTQLKDSTAREGGYAHFEARLEPVGDPALKVEWLKDGRPMEASSRVTSFFNFGYVALTVKALIVKDAGTYICRAYNAKGEAQVSCQLTVISKTDQEGESQYEDTVMKMQYLEDSSRYQRTETEDVSAVSIPPKFLGPLKGTNKILEGQKAHFEIRLEPQSDPTMTVEWYFNGQVIMSASRIKTYHDFGYVSLDISDVRQSDAGQYTVVARNSLGQAQMSTVMNVETRSAIDTTSMHEVSLSKTAALEHRHREPQYDIEELTKSKPEFTQLLQDPKPLPEGKNVHLEARLEPMNDPTMKVEWFFNGKPITIGSRFKTYFDFGFVALDILGAYTTDSGEYTCRAENYLGSAHTSACVHIQSTSDIQTDTMHDSAMEQIHYLEDASRNQRTAAEEAEINKEPSFVKSLKNIETVEGTNIHLEARLQPVGDSSMRVEWFFNDQSLKVGHRFRPAYDFDYVALDLLSVYPIDSGIYTCKATNRLGQAVTSASVKVTDSSNIVLESQNQTMTMEQLQMLEDRSRYSRTEQVEETTKQAPVFTTSLKNIEILEGQRAHFEVRLIPISDPTMKVEWFHNNTPVKSGSRFTEYNDFGFVALDIMYSYAEDSGTYTCRATNIIGQAVSTCTLVCHTKESILMDTMNQDAMNKISRLESSSRSQRTITTEETTMQAPVFTSPIKDQKLIENAPLHFEARLIPVGDPDLKVEWFKNNIPIQQANRISTMHDFGYVALDMKYVNPEDSGTYTCRATNRLGQAVTTATLMVTSKESLMLESQHTEALEKLRYLEDSSRYTKSSTEETVITQAPKFVVKLSGLTELWEGQSAHVECRLEPYPDPSMKVEWFHNGKSLQVGHRFRTMYDFGFCAMDILQAVAEDSGTYEVRATNRIGTASSSITIQVKPKSDFIIESQHPEAMAQISRLEQKAPTKRPEDAVMIEKPNFGRSLRNQDHLMEGQAIHLEATLTPVNDPTMKVEWFFNGQPIPSGHRFRTTYDFGFVALDILYAYPEDSGTYMCKATNAAGQAVTSCSIGVEGTTGMQTETLDEERLRKIRQLEAMGQRTEEAKEQVFQKPVFTTPLINVDNLVEGERCHLECRLEPINDPNLKVEWFVNGVEIKAGHRFRTTHDFGYVALDILYTYAEDSGTYLCKATNKLGEAVNSCNVKVSARRSIYLDTQHPTGWEKIQNLEQRGRYERIEVSDVPMQAPRFTSELRGNTLLSEGQHVHLEGRIEPVHDPSMRVEWYHDGKALQSAARFHTTFDFGYVALDITTVYAEDSGEYTCRAFNHMGEATSSITFKVEGKEGVIYESARPEGLEKIRQLEDSTRLGRQVSEETRTFQRPVFTQPLQNLDNLVEGETAHFECRLIPVGDPNLKVEWFRNEKPIETSSRINRTHDFGYVALDITGVRPDDEGIYMCRAYNDLGEAVTTASIKIKSHATIQLETQHPEGMRKIQALEERKPAARDDAGEKVYDKPVFTTALTGPSQVMEGQTAHYECRVVPVGDSNMRYEWYCNGVELKMGSRFTTTHDFGYVTLDILQCVSEDSGVYMCKAINKAGEAVSSCSTRVIARDSILGDALHPGWETIRLRETQWNRVPETPTSPEQQEPPMFTKHLESYERLQEAGNVRLEGQVQPAHDPNLSIEWFKNGIQLATGTRVRSTFDFGHVTLEISGLRENDSGIYTCKAVNRVGEAVSTCNVKVFDRDWLIGESVHPDALSKIAKLEKPAAGPGSPEEPTYDVPVFISHLNNVECREGDNAHFECRVEPSKDPTMKIEWFINGKPMQAAARYAATYDFGFVSLDCTHCYAEDSGIYMCRATNSKGSASTTGTLKCLSKANLYFDTQHPQGRAGLEKVEEAERAYWAKYQRQMSERDVTYPKPFFVRPLQTNFSLSENQALHMEANVEPKQDPDLKIEWFLNGKVLEQASRYKTSYDFGLVTLDLNDAYERDQGIYTCRAYNKAGEAFCTSTVVVGSKEALIESTQHPAGEAGLEAIQLMEEKNLRRADRELPDEEGHPPVFTVPFKNLSNLEEGEIAHFEAMLTPVGDQSMRVEWFFNGEPLKASHRVRTVYAFGMVVLEVLGTKIADSGEYTCRAHNKWGKAECSVTLECVDRAHGQPPKFTTQVQSLEGLKDGDSAHFECTLIPIGDPNMKVEWFHNGQPLRNATRIKTVSDFGFVVLDIAYLQNHDAGEWLCKATNKYGQDTTKAHLNCFGMGGVYTDSLQPASLDKIAALEGHKTSLRAPTTPSAAEPPKFITQISNIDRMVEGQSAHFEARLKPVNDPNLVVEWYKNGKKLPSGHRYRTFHDFGIVILDILYCYEEDSGEYEARAVNKLGEDKTTSSLKCMSKTNLILTPQVPKGMEGGLQKLQTLEDSAWMRRDSVTSERVGMAPKFTVPLSNIDSMKEGENAHFEARLVPTDDPRLKVEWYWNGKPMKYSSRIRQFCDFGFVIMEISPIYPEDSGEYMCRAFNDYGEAVTKATLKCEGKRSIILESQLPKSMQKGMERIAELEGLMIKSPDLGTPSDAGQPPQFVTQPQDSSIPENGLAHFECRLLPVNDPNLRVDWYHNGRALSAGSRIKTINDFGYVILEMANCYGKDAGTYTCRAMNKHGEASVECKLNVSTKSGIVLDPQATGKFGNLTEAIQKLEENKYKKEDVGQEEEKAFPPRFVTNLEDINDLVEGQPAHFDCRVEPVGDSTMRIEWFHNGMPLAAGSRVHMMDDFGFVVLDLEWTFARDTGEYICRATNKWGQATTKAMLNVRFKHGVDLSTQLPQGMTAEKLKELERGPLTEKFDADVEMVPPKFTVPIKSQSLQEGERAFFEARVEPRNDPNLHIEWYFNGKVLQSGHRFRTSFEMGHVTLELLHTYAEDSGEYVCRAYNKLGEDFTRATLKSKASQSVVLMSQVPKGMKSGLDFVSQMEETLKKYCKEVMLTQEDIYEPEKRQPPRFVTQIKDVKDLKEMEETKFDCQLAPVGDPNMKVEWFFNGRPLPYKNRFTPIYDFGYVALNMNWIFGEDSGEYLCRATNLWGMDETRATLKATGRPGVIYESQIPKGMQSLEKIRELEAAWQIAPESIVDEDKPRTKPEVLKKPESLMVQEGDWARFSIRVSGHPRPRVMWIVNGSTAMSGNRFKIWYDGMYHLDIPKTRQYDNGKVEVICRNSLGESYACCELKVNPRQDDYRAVLKNSPKPWYDYDLKSYQKERQDTELERVFEEKIDSDYSILHESKFGEYMAKPLDKSEEIEWQKLARQKNAGEKIKQLEDSQRTKGRSKEAHMFASPAEYAAQHSLARGMASRYEEQLDTKDVRHDEETLLQREAEPSESVVHGKEIHTSTQKQTQKEVQGDLEIHRKITATEKTEMEHTGKTTERLVQGQPQKPAKPPFFTKKIQPCRSYEREPARFQVEFDGEPNPTVQWYREDFLITSSPDFQIHTFGDKSILIIREVFMEDSGVFACVAENRGGRAKCSANLVVAERKMSRGGVVPPSFSQTIQDIQSSPGHLVRLEAKIHGTPPIDTYWLKNGRKLVQGMHYKMMLEDDMYTLLITEAVPEDSASYECVAINKAGEARCQATVEVVGPRPAQTPTTPGGAPQAPTIVQKLKSQSVQEGQGASFECVITSSPKPKIQWLKGKQPIKQSKYFTMTTDGDRYCLRISEAFPEDEGTYYFVATNPSGKCTVEAKLQVVQPQQAEVAPSVAPLEPVTVSERSGVRFNTVVVGSPMPSVQWYREGALIPNSRDFEMFMEGNTAVLDIKETYPEDTGTFTCRATNSAGQAETSAMLTVKTRKDKPRGQAPKILEPLKPLKVEHGSKAVLETTVKGQPTPKVLWYHLDREVVQSSEFVQEFDATTGRAALIISEVFIDDKGLYRCVAINQHGQDETASYVTVEDIEMLEKSELRQAPRITRPLQAQIVKTPSSLDLQARYEAFPPPTIKWYHKGKELKPSRDYTIEYIDDETSLHIEEVFDDDSGEYEVRVFNEVGEARSVATVIVTQPEEVIEMEPPKFIKPLQPQIVPEGEVAILEAEVTAKPPAEFMWYRHGQKITTDEELEVQITSEDNKTTLVLGELFEDDSGDYTITAQNPVGLASSTATLLVEGEGAEEAEPPAFSPPLTPIRVMDGEEVRFSCKVTGKPMPKLTWFQNGRPIGHHREVRLTQTPDGRAGLQILEVFPEDEGDYTCIARNKAGEARTTANLCVESYEYHPDSEAATTTSVSEKNVFSGPTSEEDETLEIEKDSESDSSEAGSSPYFCNRLEQKIEVIEGSSVRLLTKTAGYPRPTVKWHADGMPVEVTEALTLETYEDGTEALTLPYAVLDDCGEYTCEAMNRNGVDTTVTTLVVLPEHTEETSKAYRKPEWVTRMEDLKQAMSGEHTAPKFIQEITNSRVREMETITLTATFIGNPKPEITWYHNNKLIRQHASYQMRVRNDKAILTIVQVKPEVKGEYYCRAVNSVGESITKATLEVIELTYEEKMRVDDERYAAVQIQHAAEHMKEKERERAQKQRQDHQEAMQRLKQEKVERNVLKEKELEEARKNVWKPQFEETKVKVFKTPKERRVSEVYTNWKSPIALEESYPEIQPSEFAPNQIPGVKCFVKVSETSVKGEEVVREVAPQFFEDEQVIHELAKVHTMLKNNVRVSEIWSMFRAGEFKALQQPSIQTALVKICEHIGHQRNVSIVLAQETQEQATKHPVGLKAFLRMVKHAKNIKPETLFKDVIPREMGKFSSTTQELTKVSQMINQGIETEEIIAFCVAGKLPALKKPETQQPLINIVEKHGHSVMVAQVLVEEAYRDAKDEMCVPGFKALIHLATDNQVDLETVELESVEKAAFSKDIAKLSLQLKKGVQVNELMTMMKEGDFVALKRTEHQAKLLEVADRLESATVHKVLVQEARDRCDSNIGLKSVMRTIETGKESMEQVIMDVSKEFGPSSEPVKEIAAIGHLLQEGVRCDEVMTLVESGLLPSLKMPQAQVPLVSMVADKGHIGTICEVMVAESVKEIPKTKTKGAAARVSEVKELLKKAKTQCVDVKTFTSEMVPGVKAIMRMAQEDQVNIEEVVQKANLEHKLKEEVAKIGMMVKHGVLAQDVITLMEAGEFPLLMREEAQAQLLTVVEDFGFKALVNQVMTEQVEQAIQKTDKTIGVKTFIRMLEQANVNVEEIITEQFPKEFDIKEQEPISQEMAKVSVMLTEGVQAQEIISMVEAGELPHLNRPETQMPLINVVEGQGQSALIFQVLIEDSVRDIIQELPKVDVATISSVETLQSASSTKVEVKALEIAPPFSVKPGDQLRATATYVADTTQENAMHLVEGERVYIQESTNSDWWFVRKHLTLEQGYVPAKLLAEEVSYTHYVQQKLGEKITKLPVFDKLKKGQNAEPPKMVTKIEPLAVVDGQEAQFVCKIQGTPRPNITWFRQTAIIKPSEEFQVFYSDDNTATLVVKEVFPEDAGMFTCVAKNQAGYSSCTAELVVEGPISDHGSDSVVASRRSLSRESSVCDIMEGIPPTFANKPTVKTVEEGAQLEMDVRLVAIPEPEIIWKKDGQVVRESQRVRVVKQKDVHAYRSIVIIKGAKKEDEGLYEILVKNREGEAKNQITLKVTAPEAPTFEEKFQDHTVESEGTIRLVAKIRGVPAPDVTWSRNGKKLKVEKNVVMTFQEELAVLEIRNVLPKEDSGKYTCTATNKVGKSSHSANVTVGVDIVTFKRGLESCVVDENSEVVLECRTSKEKQCKWLKGKTEIKPNKNVAIEQEGLTHRLVIHSATTNDTGKYQCTFDTQSTFCNLTVKGLDDFIEKVQDVEVQEREQAVLQVEVTTEKAYVTWHKDGEEITEHHERFKLVSEGNIRKLVLPKATLADEGEYTCVLGDQECTAELTVRELPAEIVRKMKDQVVSKGNRATMEVELTKGDAVITWYKDSKEIRFSDHYQLSIDGKVQRLMVYNCQPEDVGTYRAVVGRSECSATLKVELQVEGDFSKKLPAQMDVNFKTDATFVVEITKDYEVKWLRSGINLSTSEKYEMKKEGKKRILIVKSVTQADAFEYSCVLANLKTSCVLNVVLMETAPKILKEHQKVEVVVTKGKDVTLKVPFTATPVPKVFWYHRGQLLSTEHSQKLLPTISEFEASITIRQVENIDCGEYRVKLCNDCGAAYADFTVKLLDKPSQPGTPEPMKVTNDSVTLHWTIPKEDGGRTIINYVVEYMSKKETTWVVFNQQQKITESTTVVTKLTTHEEYCFRVSAVNEIGTSEASNASRYVKVCEPVTAEPPVVKEQLQAVVTGLRQEVVLRCVVTATPAPKIEWTKDGKPVSGITRYENFTATFTIKETMETSGGMYTCRASNEAGMAECSATVVIQEAPRFEYDEKQQCQRLTVGEKWHVPIQVVGHPRPKITWARNEKSLVSTPHIVIHIDESEGSTDIAIHKLALEDSAVYTLTAENSAGRSQLSFNLRVVERPAAPMGPLVVSDVSSASLNLTWQASPYDGGMEITSYYIEKLEKSQKQWHKVAEVGPDVRTYTVTELLDGHEYFFRVFALNAFGLSDSLEVSETIILKSPFDKPGPPIGPFDVSNITESSLLLHWDEPDSDGGSSITHYVLEKRESTKKAWSKVGQTASTVTEIEVTGLKKGTSYYFRVYAYNAVGQSPPLQPEEPITAGKKITPPSKPNSLQVIDVTTKTVTLAWAPPTTTGGADLMGYVIERRLTTEKKWEKVDTVDASVTLYCVENLREKSEYEFRVFAENPVGLSLEAAMTEQVRLKTHATPPSPPTAPLEVRPTGPNSLMIEWGAPESDGGAPLLGYIIAIRDIKRTMWIEVGQVGANFTRLHIKELQEEHEYCVRVFARNEVGASDPLETEEAVKVIRPADFTELPEDDNAPSLSYSTTETLSWMREAGMDADIYSYARGRLLNRDEYFFKVWHRGMEKFDEKK